MSDARFLALRLKAIVKHPNSAGPPPRPMKYILATPWGNIGVTPIIWRTAIRAILITTDSAQDKKLVSRYLISELSATGRLLLAVSPCWAHALSNCTKCLLGLVPFGLPLRSFNVSNFIAQALHFVRAVTLRPEFVTFGCAIFIDSIYAWPAFVAIPTCLLDWDIRPSLLLAFKSLQILLRIPGELSF